MMTFLILGLAPAFCLPVKTKEVVQGGYIAKDKRYPQEGGPDQVQRGLNPRNRRQQKDKRQGLRNHLVFPHSAGVDDQSVSGGNRAQAGYTYLTADYEENQPCVHF